MPGQQCWDVFALRCYRSLDVPIVWRGLQMVASTVGLSHQCKAAKLEFCDFHTNDENLSNVKKLLKTKQTKLDILCPTKELDSR